MRRIIAKVAALVAVLASSLVVAAMPGSIPCPWDGAPMLPTHNIQQGVSAILHEFRCTLDGKHVTWVPQQ